MVLFTIKKVIAFFLMPFTIGLLLVIFGLVFLYIKKYSRAKIFFSLGFIWLFLIAYAPFSNALIKPLENKYSSYINIDPSIKYVLVLGNAHTTNKSFSEVSQLSDTALRRLIEGLRIYKKLDRAKLIVSGYAGDDKNTPHAVISKKAAISLGIKKENILMLEKAKDTQEEAEYAKHIIGEEKFILVTSASHMPRAMKIFKSKKLNPIAAPTDFLFKKEKSILTAPKAAEITKTTLAFYEYIGSFWFYILEKLRFYLN